MRVIPPLVEQPFVITEAMLTSSSASEPGPGEAAWSSSTVYVEGDRVYIGAPSSTVSISVASPAVVSWASHGLAEGTPVVFTTSGALPTGVTAGTIYYVADARTDTFKIAEEPGGAKISTTGAGSGTHTATASVHRIYESLVGASSTATLTIASPCVVTHAGHGLAAGAPVLFGTTGALPTGVTAGTVYYVLSPAADSYQLTATSDGTTAINTSGSQSGTHTVYANPNRNHPPATDDGSWWIDAGPTNRWAMLDLSRNTATAVETPLTLTITPGERVDGLGLVGLAAESVTVSVSSGGDEVYSQTVDLSTRIVVNWYDYFHAPFSWREATALFDLPPYQDAVITITIERNPDLGLVSCGGLVLGRQVYLGGTQYEAQNEARNFSKTDRDEFGEVALVKRRSIPVVSCTVIVRKPNLDKVLALRERLNAVPALWASMDDEDDGYFSAGLILGFYRQFKASLDHPDIARVALEIEEL